jgi:hypothetical protein
MKKYVNISIISLLGLFTFLLWSQLNRRFLEKYPITWTPSDWQATETLLLLTSMVLSGFLAWLLVKAVFKSKSTTLKFDALSGFLLAGGLLIVVLSLYLVIFDREYIAIQVRELGHIALAQEGFILSALVLFVLTFFRGSVGDTGSILFLRFRHILGLIVCAIFLLLMEEISWGQHIFKWATPEEFEGNLQDETNFHNFYTNRFEFVYYSLAFFAFAILPLILVTQHSELADQIQFYVPPVSFGIAALPVVTLMFENWAILPFQLYLMVAVFLVAFIIPHTRDIHRYATMLLLLLLIVQQPVGLYYGHLLHLSFELSEMRELIIAFVLMMYSIWLYAKVRNSAQHDAT